MDHAVGGVAGGFCARRGGNGMVGSKTTVGLDGGTFIRGVAGSCRAFVDRDPSWTFDRIKARTARKLNPANASQLKLPKRGSKPARNGPERNDGAIQRTAEKLTTASTALNCHGCSISSSANPLFLLRRRLPITLLHILSGRSCIHGHQRHIQFTPNVS